MAQSDQTAARRAGPGGQADGNRAALGLGADEVAFGGGEAREAVPEKRPHRGQSAVLERAGGALQVLVAGEQAGGFHAFLQLEPDAGDGLDHWTGTGLEAQKTLPQVGVAAGIGQFLYGLGE